MKELNAAYLKIVSKKCRYDIVRMIQNAGSGHIGGAMSSIDIYVLLSSLMEEQDRLIVSHGHSSAAVYAALGNTGYFDTEEAVSSFRRKPPYEGHPSIQVNGVSWCSGSLGQGLSVGCGFALAKKLRKESGNIYVVMGDGEQQKGQLQEAREFAVKYQLDNLIAVVDCNGLQASGATDEISAQSVERNYRMSGWNVVTADGHSFESLDTALKASDGHSFESLDTALKTVSGPVCILASTTMGKGIPEIENDYRYHGTVISRELAERSLERFSLTTQEQETWEKKVIRRKAVTYRYPVTAPQRVAKVPYQTGDRVEIRSAMGKALTEIALENPNFPVAVLDCDLEGSLKLAEFKKNRKEFFIECGIAEQNAATVAAAMAKSGIAAIHADFSMFNIAETYSQLRMADINKAPIKLFCTHAGLDVGEDGKTHQCIDYLGLLSNLFGFQVIVPADANQADSAVRYAMSVEKPVALIAGRSKMPVLSREDGKPLDFEYGKAQWLRKGKDAVIITYGNMVHRALKIAKACGEAGLKIGVLNVSTPLEPEMSALLKAAGTGRIITYEDHNVRTGVGTVIARILCEGGIKCQLLCKGIIHYGASMAPDELYKEQGLDEESMIKEIINLCGGQNTRHK